MSHLAPAPVLLLLASCTWISKDDIETRTDPDHDDVLLSEDCAPDDAEHSELQVFYTDADSDGRGDPLSPVEACAQPDGAVTSDDDCDDGDATVYPGAEEICGDGVVNACPQDADAAWDSCGLSADVYATDGAAVIVADLPEQGAGYRVAAGGDINGDGVPDLLIGAPGWVETDDSPLPGTQGALWVVYGPVGEGEQGLDTVGTALVGDDETLEGFGLAAVGSLDGDGYDDLLIGAPARLAYDGRSCASGEAWLSYGPVEAGDLDDAAAHFTVDLTTACLGHAVAAAGDLNEDGTTELLFGAPALGSPDDSGAAWLVDGSDVSAETDLSASGVELLGDKGSLAGYAVLGPGDLDGDGRPDLVVGSPGGAAEVYVVTDAATTATALADALTYASAEDGDKAGQALAAADLDGDGYTDLLVGARYSATNGTNAGAVYALAGPFEHSFGLSNAAATLLGANAEDQAGSAIGGLGDLDGDGREELFVGAPQEDSGGKEDGALYLIRSPVEGSVALGDQPKIIGEVPEGQLGRSAANVGDTNGDGLDDLLIGAPGAQESGSEPGRAWLWTMESY